MGIGNIGLPQILIILVIILLIFGAKRLPEIGASLGKGIRSFKSSVTGEEDIAKSDTPNDPPKSGGDAG